MTGQRAPIDPTVRFADQLKAVTARVAELERLRSIGVTYADVEFTPAGNTDASTGGYTNWVTLGSITVPTWATAARVTIMSTGIYSISSTSTYRLRARIGTSGPTAGEVVLAHLATTERVGVTLTGLVAAPSSGSQSLIVQAERTAGTGQMRADTVSRFTASVDFRP